MSVKSISFIMPTRNRSHLVKRTLGFLSDTKFPYELKICDNSEQDHRLMLRSIVENFTKLLKVELIEFDSNADSLNKVVICLDSILSEFVAFIGDDDFPVVQTYTMMAAVLQQNPKLDCVDGTEIRVALPSSTLTTTNKFSAVIYPQPDITSDSPKKRLLAHFSQYWPTWYALHRTSAILNQFSCAAKTSINILGVELLASGLALIDGKYVKLPQIHILRQVYHERSTSFASWEEMANDIDYQSDFHTLHEQLKIRLKQLGIGEAHASSCASAAIGMYLKSTASNCQYFESILNPSNLFPQPKKYYRKLLEKYYLYLARRGMQLFADTGFDGNVTIISPEELKTIYPMQRRELEQIEEYLIEKH
jgi:glycosyltransferase domain-containing protein